MSLKTIKVGESSKTDLEKICKDFDLNIGEAVEAMIAYFKKTKQNPTDQTNFIEEFKKLKNQLISFIKTQEQEKLNPILEGLVAVLQRLENTGTDKLLDYFKQEGLHWVRLDERLKARFDKSLKPFDEMFTRIVENYGKQKEAQEGILKALQDTQTKESSMRAKKLFKRLQEDLATKKNGLGFHSNVDEILKIYSKQFEDL